MSEMVIIAGPQAAGKSTVIASLDECCRTGCPFFSKRKPPALFPLQESRQIVVHANMLLGAIFMRPEHEVAIVQCDLRRMDQILARPRNRLVYLDECNVFTIAHAVGHGVGDIEKYWDEYLRRLEKLNAKVVFMDLSPEISWARRWRKYEQRLIYFPKRQHRAIMQKFHDYMEKTHGLLRGVYERFPFAKETVDASLSREEVLRATYQSLARLSRSFR